MEIWVLVVALISVVVVSIVFGQGMDEPSQKGATHMQEHFSPKRQQKQNKQRGATGGTQADIERLEAILDDAREVYPGYSTVEQFVRRAPGLVERSTMVLGQLGQKHVEDIASMNMDARKTQHRIGLERELQLEALVNDAKHLLQQTDVVEVLVSGMITKVRAAQKLEDKAQADLLVSACGVMLADFLNSGTRRENHISDKAAVALLTGGEKPAEPEAVEAEFSDEGVPEDVAVSANGSGKHA